MSQNTMSKEEYLNKVKEIDTTKEAPKQLEDTDFLTVAKERRSVRQYDPEFKMDESEIREILETAVLAPSSSNLQPWRFLVIEDQAEKEKLLPIANNQQQIVDASVVIAVLGDRNAYKNADQIYSQIAEKGNMPEDVKNMYVNSIFDNYGNFPKERLARIAHIDGGIVSNQLMLAAKAKGYDTVPMGGYDEAQFLEAFNVPENYEAVMLISLGKGTKAGFQKTRLPLDEVVQWNRYE
ncbi:MULTISPECIES: nitroreductase family protein [Halobacillus]|uniref:nitroreductase family protein n=1 Tax=Halobacillus TaxID=45667 RepID=UPI00136D2706|nr:MULTISPECIES: nitroreductase family protein [Halobacillus]MCA1024198.1 nitroreductase family protein [Halobacillus litoralis]MYL31814.1 nitroreductase family protein [Halobacillus halophilus]MYL39501.1 nitroreductase family protein [Halobacillus litoralis]